ncbi:MAG: chromate transporter [Oscillospiraceae bacterium]|nr:chromate transporter [Oscillospiraceae bacterium]
MIYLRLFFEFFKTGLFAVGGGMATIPFLYDLSDKTGWFTYDKLADMIAVSESTPGPIGVNMATFVGFTTAGIPGAICATLGLITPSVIIILIIARFLANFNDNKYVKSAFYTIRPASTALIAAAGVLVLKISLLNVDTFQQGGGILSLFDFKAIILAVIVYVLTNFVKPLKKLHPVVFIALSAVAGIVFKFAGA